jgi:hypothetical protein
VRELRKSQGSSASFLILIAPTNSRRFRKTLSPADKPSMAKQGHSAVWEYRVLLRSTQNLTTSLSYTKVFFFLFFFSGVNIAKTKQIVKIDYVFFQTDMTHKLSISPRIKSFLVVHHHIKLAMKLACDTRGNMVSYFLGKNSRQYEL